MLEPKLDSNGNIEESNIIMKLNNLFYQFLINRDWANNMNREYISSFITRIGNENLRTKFLYVDNYIKSKGQIDQSKYHCNNIVGLHN